MVFLTSDGLRASWIGPTIDNNASIFGKIPFNVSHQGDFTQEDVDGMFMIDADRYTRYHEQYLKVPDSKDMNSWELLLDAMGVSGA